MQYTILGNAILGPAYQANTKVTGVDHAVDTGQCFFQLFNKGIKSIQSTKGHNYFACS